MKSYEAFFTPGSETVSKLANGLLFGEDTDAESSIDFVIATGAADTVTGLPELEERVISPIQNVSVSKHGYEITGNRSGVAGCMAKLSINTTVEPPTAIYEEQAV